MPVTPASDAPQPITSEPSGAEFLAQVRTRLPSIIALTLLTTLLGLGYVATAKRSYTASSAIFVDPRARRIVSEDVAPSGYGTDTALFETQVSIIGSDAILRRVVMAEKLHVDADFISPVRSGLLSQLSDSVRGARANFDPIDQAVEVLARSTRVRRAQNTYVVAVDVTTGDAVKSARLANAVLKAYQDDHSAAKADAAARTNAAIDGRLEELKGQVRRAEINVDGFRRESSIVTSEGGLLNEQQLTKYNTELAVVRGQVAASKARLDEMTATLKRGVSPESLPEAMTSPVVQRLREQLATAQRREAALSSQLQSRHPVMADAAAQTASVKSQITAELRRIAEQAHNEYQLATGREREISKTLGDSQREVSETTTAQIRLRELEREADASREVLRAFLARAKETQEQQNLNVTDARVITPASVPPRPSSPHIPLVLALSALAGLGLGTVRALFTSGIGTIGRHQTVRRHTSRPVSLRASAEPVPGLGAIPALRQHGAFAGMLGREPHVGPSEILAALSATKPAAHQTYRSAVERTAGRLRHLARAHLGHADSPQVLLMISATRGAGTSLTALAVAYVRARAGERVLLVDAASCDPTLSLELAGDLQQDEPCRLDSKDHLAAITSREPVSGLAFLPIALADLRTLTLGQRKRLSTGLARLAADYDVVVIDGGALDEDASIAALGDLATSVVVVAKAGTSTTIDARALADRLDIAPERMAGVLTTMTSDPNMTWAAA